MPKSIPFSDLQEEVGDKIIAAIAEKIRERLVKMNETGLHFAPGDTLQITWRIDFNGLFVILGDEGGGGKKLLDLKEVWAAVRDASTVS